MDYSRSSIVSNYGLCGAFAELLPLTITTACELKQEQLYLSKEETGMFWGFGFCFFY